MGKKYIVEVGRLERLYKAYVNGNGKPNITWLSPEFDLTPYTEPDLEQVRKEAYEEGKKQAKVQAELDVCHDIEKVAKGNYKAGLADAWEAARKIADMPYDEGEKIFGVSGWHIIEKCTVDEVIAEIKALEESEESKKERSVTIEDVMRQYLDTFCSKCKGCGACILNTSDFTCGRGHHFLTDNRVSDEEVRRAYAKVVKEK